MQDWRIATSIFQSGTFESTGNICDIEFVIAQYKINLFNFKIIYMFLYI